jgi:hypothetical protein
VPSPAAVPINGGLHQITGVQTRPDANAINSKPFWKQLEKLRALRLFLLQEGVAIPENEQQVLRLNDLNNLTLDAGNGRPPRPEEWHLVEERTQVLFGLLDAPLRRKFVISGAPKMMSLMPIVVGIVAIVAIGVGFTAKNAGLSAAEATGWMFASYIFWLLCLGAIGAVAFMGMNVLSVQQDVTFDVTNDNLIYLRIVLGSAFALILSLPFGFAYYRAFLTSLTGEGGTAEFAGASFLILPFVLGFSTTLVIMVLNRFVEAGQAFFGRVAGGPPPTPPPAAPPQGH